MGGWALWIMGPLPYLKGMGVDALALLRLSTSTEQTAEPQPNTAQVLEDGALVVYLNQPFAAYARDEQAGGHALRRSLGDVLSLHQDPRGVFVFPAIAYPQAHAYETLVQEMGEAGVWVPVVARDPSDPLPVELPEAMGGMQQMLSQMMGALPPEMAVRVQQALSGDPAAMAELQGYLPPPDQLAEFMQDMFPGALEAMSAGVPTPNLSPEVLRKAERAMREALERGSIEVPDEDEDPKPRS